MGGGSMRLLWLGILVGVIGVIGFGVHHVHGHGGDPETVVEDEDDLSDPSSDSKASGPPEFEVQYVSPKPSGPAYFAEHFDDPDVARKRWLFSKAQKEDQQNVYKYDGQWDFQLPSTPILDGDRGLVLRSKAKHAAIAAKLDQIFKFNNKPLFVQYEVTFQNGMDCGGAYIKLLSHDPKLQLDQFYDKTPYTIMFGPDKCGNDYKLHFIFRHKNPLNGSFEEKHAKRPSNRLEEKFTDKKPHLYLLKLFPDNSYQVIVDGALINSGNLLEDMNPPVNPPMEIEDVNDKKPADWDEREKIPDLTATKPEDWDEDAPRKIPQPDAVIPDGWLLNEPATIPDENAVKPEDWDENMDGDWEPPNLPNPACASAPGCGIWAPPEVDNPNYKGKWKPPLISNPNYKGKWSPRKIQNPDYFEDKEPFKMTPISAVGIEIWTMTDLVLFDNFIITDDEGVLEEWTKDTFQLKQRVIGFDSEGLVGRVLSYTNAHPWLWAVYLLVIALPTVLIFVFCCGSSDKKSDPALHKKMDDFPEEEVEEEQEGEVGPEFTGFVKKTRSTKKKEELEDDDDEDVEEVNQDEEEEPELSEEVEAAEEDEDTQSLIKHKKSPTPEASGPKKRRSRARRD